MVQGQKVYHQIAVQMVKNSTVAAAQRMKNAICFEIPQYVGGSVAIMFCLMFALLGEQAHSVVTASAAHELLKRQYSKPHNKLDMNSGRILLKVEHIIAVCETVV